MIEISWYHHIIWHLVAYWEIIIYFWDGRKLLGRWSRVEIYGIDTLKFCNLELYFLSIPFVWFKVMLYIEAQFLAYPLLLTFFIFWFLFSSSGALHFERISKEVNCWNGGKQFLVIKFCKNLVILLGTCEFYHLNIILTHSSHVLNSLSISVAQHVKFLVLNRR